MRSPPGIPLIFCFLGFFGVGTLPPGAEAQARGNEAEVKAWPASWSATEAVPARPLAQERRLPVYDDSGEIIPFVLIQARVDRSGARGAFWGAFLGSAVGGAVGAAIAPLDCDRVAGRLRYYCSPREEALNGALPGGLAILFGMLGAWAGWEIDVTTFDEAVAAIRLRRRLGR